MRPEKGRKEAKKWQATSFAMIGMAFVQTVGSIELLGQ